MALDEDFTPIDRHLRLLLIIKTVLYQLPVICEHAWNFGSSFAKLFAAHPPEA